MEDNMQSSFKRHFSPFPDKGSNKRLKFHDQSLDSFQASETIYRILCDSRKIGSVIGKGGGIVKALREETQAKITVADPVLNLEERVIIIHSFSTKKPVKNINKDGNMELQCAAQDALLKVHDKIVEEDVNDNKTMVTTRLLVPHNNIGCLLGKKGDVIQRLRSETGANIRILPPDQLPVCAMTTDELVQISAKPTIAKRALYEVSTLLHLNPRKDKPPPGCEHLRFGPVEFDADCAISHGREGPAEFSMKILCPVGKIGGVIGKGGFNVRQLQLETGTTIHVDDVAGESDERVIYVSSFEALWDRRSQTIDAILVLQDKTSDYSEKGIITTRLLIPSSKVGCIIGQGGQIINEMRWRTKADIRVYTKEEKPKCAGVDEELLQVSGSYGAVKDALVEIASRYRRRCLQDTKPRPEPALPRDHEPYSREPYSHEAYSRRAPLWDYYEPRGYFSPARDFEIPPNAAGYLGVVDLKRPSSGQGFASEIRGTRLKLQDPYAGGSESILNSTHNTYRYYVGQTRPLQSSYNYNYALHQEPYTDFSPTRVNPPYHHHNQNNPPYQGRYSESPYHF